MADPARNEMIDANLFESWRLLASAPGVDLYDGREMLRFVSGVDYPLCNGVLRIDLEATEAENRMAEAVSIFREKKLPALCWVTPTTRPSGLSSTLEALGLEKADEATGMAVELSSLPEVDFPDGMRVQVVTDPDGLSSWMDVFCDVYEIPPAARDFFFAAMTHAGLGSATPFTHYTVTSEGSQVACSSTFRLENVVGLYNVGTLPSARGKGAGTAASLLPLKEAERAGCTTAVLHSTGMGRPVYDRLGFEAFSTLSAYLYTP